MGRLLYTAKSDIQVQISSTLTAILEPVLNTWQSAAAFEPWFSLLLFSAASFLMIWRLGALERKGFAGTVLGTLIMPYASGLSNLVFAYVIGRSGGNAILVLENCLVNNTTNLTLLLGLPALLWGLNLFPEQKGNRISGFRSQNHRLNRLSLMLTLVAVLFFSGVLWALLRDNVLDFNDGLVLVGVFVFWQVFHVFDVLKHNIQRGRGLHWSMALDVILVVLGGGAIFGAVERLVQWMPKTGTGWLVFDNLGWISGMLMTLPNALLAIYYARAGRADIVYSSQAGDGHICIPMCVGLTALFTGIRMPSYFNLGIGIILAVCLLHLVFLALWGRLPRPIGLLCIAAYGFFIYQGVLPI